MLFLHLALGLLNKYVDKLEMKIIIIIIIIIGIITVLVVIRLAINQRFLALCFLRYQDISVLKAAGCSEILLASYRTVRRHVREDHILQ